MDAEAGGTERRDGGEVSGRSGDKDTPGIVGVPALPQRVRNAACLAIGEAIAEKLTELLTQCSEQPPNPVRLHPIVTAHDVDWLGPYVEEAFKSLGPLLEEDLADERRIGKRLRPELARMADRLQIAADIGHTLGFVNDRGESGAPGPLGHVRGALRAVVCAAGNGVRVLMARSSVESEEALDALGRALTEFGDDKHAMDALWSRKGYVRTAELWAVALEATAGPVDTRNQAVRHYAGQIPVGVALPETHRPFRPEHLEAADRLTAFAERQMRFISAPPPVPADPLSAADYFTLCWRLLGTPYLGLAHASAVRTADLVRRAATVNRQALVKRLAAFQDEDVNQIVESGRHADASLAASTNPLGDLSAYLSLAEGVARPWLRLALDLEDIATSRRPSDRAKALLNSLIEQAEASSIKGSALRLLIDPLDIAFRRAAAHAGASIGLDGKLLLRHRDGVVSEPMEPTVVRGKFQGLRSVFTGFDIAVYAHLPVLLRGNSSAMTAVGIGLLKQVADLYVLMNGAPAVLEVDHGSGGPVLVTEEPWPVQFVEAFALVLSRFAADQIERIRFRSGDVELTVPIPPLR